LATNGTVSEAKELLEELQEALYALTETLRREAHPKK
jgi:hypothetical protein